jgi:hypothetical protein
MLYNWIYGQKGNGTGDSNRGPRGARCNLAREDVGTGQGGIGRRGYGYAVGSTGIYANIGGKYGNS